MNSQIILNQIIIGLYRGSEYWLIASGLTLIFGVLRVINFAHAALLVLGGYITYSFYNITHNVLLSIILAALAVGIIGISVEKFLLKPIRGADPVYQLLITFAVVLMLNDATKLIWGALPVSVPLPTFLSQGIILQEIVLSYYMILYIVVGILVYLFLSYIVTGTMIGLRIRAVWRRPEIAEALGINTSNIYALVFAIGSIIAGLGGGVTILYSPLAPGLGDSLIIATFVVVVIAGLGNILGAYLSSLIVGVLEALFAALIPELDIMLIYLIMAIVLLVRPKGLFGER